MQVISEIGRTHLKWALTDGVGPLRFARIIEKFGDAEKALGASAADLESIDKIGRATADTILRSRDTIRIEDEILAAAELNCRILCSADPDYPPGLLQIPDRPIVLYVRGELRPTDTLAIAIVGSRRCTIYGSEQARRFAELLAQAGFTIVSGLARGIDSFAHHGAIDAKGRTIAVLGGGLESVYPPENKALGDQILTCGAWISELPIRVAVRAQNFPSRNRIIAGMSLGTLVIEAAARSGALITARLATEYNREVFAIPGRVQDPMSIGTNGLIRQSAAKLVMGLEDILDELGEIGAKMRAGVEIQEPFTRAARTAQEREARAASAAPTLFENPPPSAAPPRAKAPPGGMVTASLSDVERRVFELIGPEPLLQDVILRNAALPPGDVIAAFTILELRGLIRRLPGQLLVRRALA